MIQRRQIGEVAGMRLPEVERAHWSTFVWVDVHDPEDGSDAGVVVDAAAAGFQGNVLLRFGGVAFVEFADPVAAIDFALHIVPPVNDDVFSAAGIHVGRVTSQESPLCSHASQVAAAILDFADPGATLVTGAVLVELGDAGFDRYLRSTGISAELDGETMTLYGFAARSDASPGGAPTPTA